MILALLTIATALSAFAAVWVWSMCKAAARPLPTAPGSSRRNRHGHRLAKGLALSKAVRRMS